MLCNLRVNCEQYGGFTHMIRACNAVLSISVAYCKRNESARSSLDTLNVIKVIMYLILFGNYKYYYSYLSSMERYSGKMSAHAPQICDSSENRLRMLYFNRQIHTCYHNICCC